MPRDAKAAEWLPLLAEQDQDLAAGLEWWDNVSFDEKVEVWMAIQNLGGTAIRELVSRFAQLGFTHLALEATQRESS